MFLLILFEISLKKMFKFLDMKDFEQEFGEEKIIEDDFKNIDHVGFCFFFKFFYKKIFMVANF